MALIVFLRGINVGGHRSFRPSVLARELRAYDVVNVGATGTFIARKPRARAKFLAELRQKLPFDAELAFCDGSDLLRLEMENPFGPETSSPEVVRFVSISSKTVQDKVSLPIAIPESGDWFVRIIATKGCLVFGVYRRHMRTIGYRPDRYALRRPCDNTQLEHNTFSAADFERPPSFCENEAQCQTKI